jgi:hypothetical protein
MSKCILVVEDQGAERDSLPGFGEQTLGQV